MNDGTSVEQKTNVRPSGASLWYWQTCLWYQQLESNICGTLKASLWSHGSVFVLGAPQSTKTSSRWNPDFDWSWSERSVLSWDQPDFQNLSSTSNKGGLKSRISFKFSVSSMMPLKIHTYMPRNTLLFMFFKQGLHSDPSSWHTADTNLREFCVLTPTAPKTVRPHRLLWPC